MQQQQQQQQQHCWAERFRPCELDDILGHLPSHTREVLSRYFTNRAQITPNLLLLGPPGCGKTTLAAAMARHYFLQVCSLPEIPPQSVIYLNVVNGVRGGDAITSHDCILRNLLSTQHPFCPQLMRFVILDEVETLSRDAQRTLKDLLMLARRTASKLRFFLLSNFEWQILPELRRATLPLRVSPPGPHTVRQHLERILAQAQVQVPSPDIDQIVSDARGDIRAAIHAMQQRFALV